MCDRLRTSICTTGISKRVSIKANYSFPLEKTSDDPKPPEANSKDPTGLVLGQRTTIRSEYGQEPATWLRTIKSLASVLTISTEGDISIAAFSSVAEVPYEVPGRLRRLEG